MKLKLWLAIIVFILGCICGFFFFPSKAEATSYPQYTGYANDYTNTLKQEELQKLNTKLTEFDKQTTNQIAVALIKTTMPESIEEYSIHLADQWKPGQKGKDNGILMIFAMDDRKMRIEVGRGLEGLLTDVQSKHIIDNTITPEFKNKNYYAGIDKGVDQIMIIISPDSPIASVAAKAVSDSAKADVILLIIVIFVVIVVVIIMVAASPYTPIGGQGTWGITSAYHSTGGGFFSSGSSSGSSFGGGSFSGGGSSGGW